MVGTRQCLPSPPLLFLCIFSWEMSVSPPASSRGEVAVACLLLSEPCRSGMVAHACLGRRRLGTLLGGRHLEPTPERVLSPSPPVSENPAAAVGEALGGSFFLKCTLRVVRARRRGEGRRGDVEWPWPRLKCFPVCCAGDDSRARGRRRPARRRGRAVPSFGLLPPRDFCCRCPQRFSNLVSFSFWSLTHFFFG